MKRQICLTWHFLLFSPDQKCVSDLVTTGDISLVRHSINLPVGWSQFGAVILSEDWMKVAQRKGENLFSESEERFSCAIHWPLLLNHHPHWDPLKNQIIFATISTSVTSVNMEMEASFLPYHRNDSYFISKRVFLYWASKGFSVTLTLLDYACKAINGLVHQSMEGFILRRRVLIGRW